MKQIRNNDPAHHRIALGDGEYLYGGKVATVSEERFEELATDPALNVSEVTASLKGKTREELDNLLEEAGLDPADYENKDAAIEALES